MSRKENIPVTMDFNNSKVIGSLNIDIDDVTMHLLANGLVTFAPAYTAKLTEETDGVVEYKDAELVEISLVPTQNYINFLKQKGLYNDNDNSTHSIKK